MAEKKPTEPTIPAPLATDQEPTAPLQTDAPHAAPLTAPSGKQKAAPTHYRVMHTMVGAWREGEVLTADTVTTALRNQLTRKEDTRSQSDQEKERDAALARLLTTGAIAPTSAPEPVEE